MTLDPTAILSLISELYTQIGQLREQNEQLQRTLAQIAELKPDVAS